MRRARRRVTATCAKWLTGALAGVFASGCVTVGSGVSEAEKNQQINQATPLIPDTTIKLSPSVSYTLEQLALSAAGAALIYYIYDPLAPNWSIEEAKLGDDTYRLALKMKRFHRGGDGEAMLVMKRRATQLKVEKGYADYQILEFSEGIESSTPLAQRYGEGVIRLVRAPPQR